MEMENLCKHLQEIAKAGGEVHASLCQFCPDRGFCGPCYNEHQEKHEAQGARKVD